MPLTDSVSSVRADISASDFCVSVDTSRRTLPTRNVRYMKNGSMPSDRIVSRQSMSHIAMTVLIAIAKLRGDRARGVGHDRLDAADVVRQPALDLAGPRLGEEPQRHALEVGVQRGAQVLHDALADQVVEVGLPDADQARDDRQRDHQPDEQVQQEEVPLRDRDVDEELEQDRVDQPEEARDEDRDQDDRDLRPVRPEEDEDAADRLAAALLGDRFEVGDGATEHAAAAAAARPSATTADAAGRGTRASARECHPAYQAVAVAASVIPCASSQRSASIAALQPSAAAVTACR